MSDLFTQWFDLLWLPIIFFCVHKPHRLLAVGFAGACLLMVRMQYELAEAVGFGREGIPGLMRSDPFIRGQVTYSIFIALFIILSIFSKNTMKTVYLAAAISIFFMAFIVSTVVMIL